MEQIAIHQICKEQGKFITKDEHLPPEKQRKTSEDYRNKAKEIGDNVLKLFKKMKEHKPKTYIQSFRGIISLQTKYDNNIIDQACKRALDFNTLEYQSVKHICKNNLYDKKKENLSVKNVSGFATNLKKYDELFNNYNLN